MTKSMTTRRELPQRRHCETFAMEFGGLNRKFFVTIGYYNNGDLGEVFINFPHTGAGSEAVGRDGAVLLSLALQYGVPLQTIQHAVTRDSSNGPSSIIGAVVDRLMQEEVP